MMGPKPKPRGTLTVTDPAPWPCSKCGKALLVGDYYKHPTGSYGYSKTCKVCANAASRADHTRRGTDYARDQKLRRNFNITLAERDAMLIAQGGGCAVCGTTEPGPHDWHVDHDHSCCPDPGKSCGKCVRGILCHRHNLMLGQAQDDIAVLESAIAYLRSYSGVLARATP